MQNNAFTAGIDPGGLTNDYEIKILVCYILEKIKRHMTFSEINYILQSEGLANYFEYAEAISELLSSGHIVDISQGEGEQRFRLSDLGVKTARTFEKIKKRFLCDPTIFYRGIIALVTGDEHTVHTILQETLEE